VNGGIHSTDAHDVKLEQVEEVSAISAVHQQHVCILPVDRLGVVECEEYVILAAERVHFVYNEVVTGLQIP
jgi:hypothetical protein